MAGSSMLAMILIVAPQCSQALMPMLKTRFRRCAEAHAGVTVRGCLVAPARYRICRVGHGVICARQALLGANRMRCCRGFGTRAASLAMKDSGYPALHPCGASLRLFKIVPDNFVQWLEHDVGCAIAIGRFQSGDQLCSRHRHQGLAYFHRPLHRRGKLEADDARTQP